jgi:hypothetical protein
MFTNYALPRIILGGAFSLGVPMRKAAVVLTAEIASTILDRVADGEFLRNICADNPDLPTREAFRRACRADPVLTADYDRARGEAADKYVSEIIDIADNEKDPQVAKNRIDARKWVASKFNPKHYGDRQKVDVSVSVADMTDDAMNAELFALVGVKITNPE